MQTVEKILKISGNTGTWITDEGATDIAPEIAIGVICKLRFDLRTDAKEDDMLTYKSIPFSQVNCGAYYLALDSDYLQETDPKFFKSTGIEVFEENGKTYLECELPNTANQSLITALNNGEKVTLKGEIGGYSGDDTTFIIQFSFTIRNRIYLQGEVPDTIVNDSEYYTKAELNSLIAELKISKKGETGANAYELAVENGFEGSETEWLESLKGETGLTGENGKDGKTPKDGETGKTGLTGADGKDGNGLHVNVAGELIELSAYDDEAQGFTFMFNAEDGTPYFYVKNSDETADWGGPVKFIGKDGKDGKNVEFIEPLDFIKDDGNILNFTLSNGAVHVNCVCIDTEEGELTLPYWNAAGITKILRKDNAIKIYFGSLVQTFETGRVYFSQGAVESEDAVVVNQKMFYGYKSGLSDLSNLSDLSDLTDVDLETLNKQSLGTGSAGSFAVVVLPLDADYIATKFNGINGDMPFNTSYGGANGKIVTINNKQYKVYGEFMLMEGEQFIYVK